MHYGINSRPCAQSVSIIFDLKWYSVNLDNKRKPWISQHIRCLSHKKQQLYNLAKLSQSPNHSVENILKKRCYMHVIQRKTIMDGYINKKLWSYNIKRTLAVFQHYLKWIIVCRPYSNQKAEILNSYSSSVFSDKKSTLPFLDKFLFQIQSLLTCME